MFIVLSAHKGSFEILGEIGEEFAEDFNTELLAIKAEECPADAVGEIEPSMMRQYTLEFNEPWTDNKVSPDELNDQFTHLILDRKVQYMNVMSVELK